MTLKQKVYQHYGQVINDKIHLLQNVLADLKESGSNETKSTAGDKHETALAMLQIEQEKMRNQLQEALSQKAALDKINPELVALHISIGSLVKTNKGFFYISVALGKSLVDENNIIAISPQSPLGLKLLGLSINSIAEMNNNRYIVESIL